MTFSIVARDPETDAVGVAVQSKFVAVGSVVPFASADAGAIATQSLANVAYGSDGLDLLRAGHSADEVVAELTNTDDEAPQRQVGVVGQTAPWRRSRARSASTTPATGRATTTPPRGTSWRTGRRSTRWPTRSRTPTAGCPSGCWRRSTPATTRAATSVASRARPCTSPSPGWLRRRKRPLDRRARRRPRPPHRRARTGVPHLRHHAAGACRPTEYRELAGDTAESVLAALSGWGSTTALLAARSGTPSATRWRRFRP